MIIIGEKINATRKSIAEALKNKQADIIQAVAKAQDYSGADVIDVNAGAGRSDISTQIEDMKWLVKVVRSATHKPLMIDSENPEVLEAGLKEAKNLSPWINSVSAEEKRLATVLKLAVEYDAPLIALCMDDSGLPSNVEDRIKAAQKIFEQAVSMGINGQKIYFDPLVMPIGAEDKAGRIILHTIKEIKKLFSPAKTAVGLSNVSFGLPARPIVNSTFLALCMSEGLDAAIMDPTDDNLMMTLRAGKAILGEDSYCADYIKEFRHRNKNRI